MKFTRRLFLLSGAGLVAAGISGCGPRMVKIKGKVMYKNGPVTGGTLMVARADGKATPVSTELAENGTFEITAPAGEVQFTVDNRALKGSSGPVGTSGSYYQGDKKDVPGVGGPGGGGRPGPPGAGAGGKPGSGPPQIPQNDEMKKRMQDKGAPGFENVKKGTYMQIPEKYYSFQTSDLKATIKEGDEITLELKD